MRSILLVEDDPFLIDIYVTRLKGEGYSVEVAPDGEIALDKLKKGKFDLAVLDIILPKLDGWEVLKRIKGNPKFKNLKVIILSNLGQKEEVETGFELGAVKYFVKAEYTPTEVVEEIKKMLE